MNFKIHTICFLLMFGISIPPGFTQGVSIQIVQEQTNTPIVGAHIISADQVIAVSDMNGFFTVDTLKVDFPIMIHALAYQSVSVTMLNNGQRLVLSPKTVSSDQEIVINGESENRHNLHQYKHQSSDISMDDFLSSVDGMSMIQRGAFAWEPSIRGQSDQRLNVMIDGMAVFKACVDKMDPITSYVEVNNLASLKVDKNGASVAKNGNGYASINMQTEKASFNEQELDFESNYKAPNNMYLFRLNTSGSSSNNRFSYRLSGSYRKAGELVAGNNITVENTQFEKWNLNLSMLMNVSKKIQIETNYITDKAYDVGYPALLMDASAALADILRVQVNIKETEASFSVQSMAVYANLIRHTMDDYSRDVSQRRVMRNMNMPMYGETKTYGFTTQGLFRTENRLFNWYLNGYKSTSFGDMEMISTLPDITDMYIYNLNDIITNNISLGISHNWLLSNRANLSIEQNFQLVTVQSGNASYNSLFEGIYQKRINERVQLLPSFSTSLLYMLSEELSLTNTLVYSSRTGNHIEQYGHYVYNYVDGFFYDGNPWLKNEHAFNVEITLVLERSSYSISLSAFSRFYHNYIDGMLYTIDNTRGLGFKRYSNVGNALFSGGEFRTIQRFGNNIFLDHRMAYVYAQNLSLNEPVPLIPPLNGSSMLNFKVSDISSIVTLEWATEQDRIATNTSIEDRTRGYAIIHASISRTWSKKRVTTSLNFRNITDRYYHTHTSIGNIPSEGFSVMLGLTFEI